MVWEHGPKGKHAGGGGDGHKSNIPMPINAPLAGLVGWGQAFDRADMDKNGMIGEAELYVVLLKIYEEVRIGPSL